MQRKNFLDKVCRRRVFFCLFCVCVVCVSSFVFSVCPTADVLLLSLILQVAQHASLHLKLVSAGVEVLLPRSAGNSRRPMFGNSHFLTHVAFADSLSDILAISVRIILAGWWSYQRSHVPMPQMARLELSSLQSPEQRPHTASQLPGLMRVQPVADSAGPLSSFRALQPINAQTDPDGMTWSQWTEHYHHYNVLLRAAACVWPSYSSWASSFAAAASPSSAKESIAIVSSCAVRAHLHVLRTRVRVFAWLLITLLHSDILCRP